MCVCSLLTRNLPYEGEEEDVYDEFSQFGSINYARIVLDPKTGHSRGKCNTSENRCFTSTTRHDTISLVLDVYIYVIDVERYNVLAFQELVSCNLKRRKMLTIA